MIFINNLYPPNKWIFVSIPIIFVVGACFHFLYDLFNKFILMGAIAPVNESVWEHTKMLLPIMIWWIFLYIIKGKKYSLDINKWFTGMLVSFTASLIFMLFAYYFYTGAFGVEILIVDILILLMSITVGQLLGYTVFMRSKGINVYVTMELVLLIIIVYVVWTLNPPKLPLFFDKEAGKYGI